jgi:hypothetical protein
MEDITRRTEKFMTVLGKAQADPLLPLIAEVVDEILNAGNVVAPLEVLVRLEIIEREQVEIWRRGGFPYLERAITSGLSRAGRVLRLVREHCLALGLQPTRGKYLRSGKGPRQRLRFSKRGDEQSELGFATHFVRRKS